MTRRISDLVLALLASVGAFLLSWPFWRDFNYWPVSHVAWWIYFVLGFLLSVYVFDVFIGSLHVIFLHGAHGHDAHGHDAHGHDAHRHDAHGHGAHEAAAPPADNPDVADGKERRS